MLRIAKDDLIRLVVEGFAAGGAAAHLLNRTHPFRIFATNGIETKSFRVYLWNITHGGGAARAASEYRIQVTGVPRFDPAGVDTVLILGWWQEGQVFAGWDFRKHSRALGSSPSFQVGLEALKMAAIDGTGWHRKDNGETAVTFQPRMMSSYSFNAADFHTVGEAARDLILVREAVAESTTSPEEVIERAPKARRTVITTVTRKVRDAAFAARVMSAYGNACALCGVQLRLLDAAHILPVEAEGGDEVPNGMALCALHHRAFDKSLVTIRPDYSVCVNPDQMTRLAAENLVGGLEEFRNNLKKIPGLPPSQRDRPTQRLIDKANQIRGWARFEPI